MQTRPTAPSRCPSAPSRCPTAPSRRPTAPSRCPTAPSRCPTAFSAILHSHPSVLWPHPSVVRSRPSGIGDRTMLAPPHRLPHHKDRPPCPLVRGEGQGLLVGQRVVTNANESLEMSAPGCGRADLLASLWESLRSGSQSLPHQQQKGHFPTQYLLQALIFPNAVAVFQQRLFEEP